MQHLFDFAAWVMPTHTGAETKAIVLRLVAVSPAMPGVRIVEKPGDEWADGWHVMSFRSTVHAHP